MAITLNHTIVPAHAKEPSAKFFARIFGLTYEGLVEHFAPRASERHLDPRLRGSPPVREPSLCLSRKRRGVNRTGW